MLKRLAYSCTRYYGELEDDFDYEMFAKNRLDALLLIVADLNDIYAEDAEEAKQKAKEWLDAELGKSWTVEDFLKANLPLWKDNATCYEVRDLHEVN